MHFGPTAVGHIGTWCNGNTTGFGSVILGSNPGVPTNELRGVAEASSVETKDGTVL